MSRNVYRLMIVLLLALAIPLQGLAASSAGLCMAMGQHHDAGMAHHHAGDDEGAAHHHSGGHPSDGKNAQESPHCPPCVSCCAAAVIAPALLPSLSAQPASAAIATLAQSVSGALPDELDRPPLAS